SFLGLEMLNVCLLLVRSRNTPAGFACRALLGKGGASSPPTHQPPPPCFGWSPSPTSGGGSGGSFWKAGGASPSPAGASLPKGRFTRVGIHKRQGGNTLHLPAEQFPPSRVVGRRMIPATEAKMTGNDRPRQTTKREREPWEKRH